MINQEFIESIRLEGEEWRPIIGYEDHYYVSSFGRIFANRGNRSTILKGEANNTQRGYVRVDLYSHCKRKRVFVHKVVAKMFLPNPHNYPFVDHINGDTKDNRVSNLRWCTRQQNIDNPNTRPYCGKHKSNHRWHIRPVAAFNEEIVIFYNSIREAYYDGYTYNYIASAIRSGKKYKGLYWKDLENYISMSKNS